jgi:hypothetical protein
MLLLRDLPQQKSGFSAVSFYLLASSTFINVSRVKRYKLVFIYTLLNKTGNLSDIPGRIKWTETYVYRSLKPESIHTEIIVPGAFFDLQHRTQVCLSDAYTDCNAVLPFSSNTFPQGNRYFVICCHRLPGIGVMYI